MPSDRRQQWWRRSHSPPNHRRRRSLSRDRRRRSRSRRRRSRSRSLSSSEEREVTRQKVERELVLDDWTWLRAKVGDARALDTSAALEAEPQDELKNQVGSLSEVDARQFVNKCFNGDASECEELFRQVSLLDPISLCRISLPVRSKNCNHIQCFDLRTHLVNNFLSEKSYLKLSLEKNFKKSVAVAKRLWRCPICSALASRGVLLADPFTQRIIAETSVDTARVLIYPSGKYTVCTEPTEEVASSDADEHSNKESSKPVLEDEIDLTLSDDEAVAFPTRSAVSVPAVVSSAPKLAAAAAASKLAAVAAAPKLAAAAAAPKLAAAAPKPSFISKSSSSSKPFPIPSPPSSTASVAFSTASSLQSVSSSVQSVSSQSTSSNLPVTTTLLTSAPTPRFSPAVAHDRAPASSIAPQNGISAVPSSLVALTSTTPLVTTLSKSVSSPPIPERAFVSVPPGPSIVNEGVRSEVLSKSEAEQIAVHSRVACTPSLSPESAKEVVPSTKDSIPVSVVSASNPLVFSPVQPMEVIVPVGVVDSLFACDVVMP